MSSKRHLRRTKCERKIKYKSAGAARAAARRFLDMGGDRLTAYPCDIKPGHWHLGHPTNVHEQRIAEKMAEQRNKRRLRAA